MGPLQDFLGPYFFGGPSKICMSKRIYQLFSENINKLITKENNAGRYDSLIVIIHNVQNSKS